MELKQQIRDKLLEQGWTEEEISKLPEALRIMAIFYDSNHGSYPEHMYEGHSVFTYCLDEDGSDIEDAEEWEAATTVLIDRGAFKDRVPAAQVQDYIDYDSEKDV